MTVLCSPLAVAAADAAEPPEESVRSNSVVFKRNNFCLHVGNAYMYKSIIPPKVKNHYSDSE